MLPEDLIKRAIVAQTRAKARFSNYLVGTALLTTDNSVILGCNIESKAYPTTLCAERVAIFSAISQGYKDFSAMALITQDGAFPCGSCRQIIYEYAGNISIYIAKDIDNYVTQTISDLLPFPFG